MELKEFIKTALTDITDAVSELQEKLTRGYCVAVTPERGRQCDCERPIERQGQQADIQD